MKIISVLNNNVIMTTDDDDIEYVVMSRGIGFHFKVGDEIGDDQQIEKIFTIHSDRHHLLELLKEVSDQEVQLVNDIISHAEEVLNQSFQSNLFTTLADHIHFLIERTREGMVYTNPLSWNVKRLYNNQYRVGQRAVQMIEDEFDIQIPDSEAASIAIHLLNASKEDSQLEDTYQVNIIISEILKIVELNYQQRFDEESLSFSRFITHIQYFAQRVLKKVIFEKKEVSFLYEQVKLTYSEAFDTTQKIVGLIEQKYDYSVGREEKIYLTIHIERITQNT